jgi:hypothetical protein
VVGFTLRLLYPRGKSVRYPMDKRLGGSPLGYGIMHQALRHEGVWGSERIDPHVLGPAALHSGKDTPVLNGQEAGWTLEPVWILWIGEILCIWRNPNSDPSVVQPVASRYTDCSNPAPRRNGLF